MRVWRMLAIILGVSVMVGELVRSWGQGRSLIFVVDDFLIGVPFVVTAVLMGKPTLVRRCALSASFAAAAGMLYPSFFSKIVRMDGPMYSNVSPVLLTALIGVAFVASLVGLFGTLLSYRDRNDA